MVICQLSSDTCAVRLIDSLGRKLMLTCQDTRDGRKGAGHRLNHPSRREKSKWNYQSDKPNPNLYPLLPLSVDNGVNDGDDDDADERGRDGGRERERKSTASGWKIQFQFAIWKMKFVWGSKLMTIFLYTHIVYYRVQSAWPTVHPSSDLANGACLLSLRFCHDGAVERDQVFQGSQTAKKKNG